MAKHWTSTGPKLCDTTWAHLRSFMNDEGSEIWPLSPKSSISSWGFGLVRQAVGRRFFPTSWLDVQSSQHWLTTKRVRQTVIPLMILMQTHDIYGAMNCHWQFSGCPKRMFQLPQLAFRSNHNYTYNNRQDDSHRISSTVHVSNCVIIYDMYILIYKCYKYIMYPR